MKQIWLVTKREFLVEVRKKSFLILTLATPLLIVGLIALVAFLSKANEEVNSTAIIDESGLFTSTFKSNEQEVYAFYPISDLQGLKDSLSESKYLQSILHIPKADSGFVNLQKDIELFTNKNMGIRQITALQSQISNTLEDINLEKRGLPKELLEKLKVPVKIQIKKESDTGVSESNQMSESVKTALSYFLMYAIFMFIMIYAIRVMRSVIEEKNNRVVEIIISSVKPFNLMMGKILGTTFVAMTQFVIWIAIILLLMFLFPMFVSGGMPSGELTQVAMETPSMAGDVQAVINTLFELNYPFIISTFLVYFFFGYLLYSSFFAAIGASVDNETETQQFMWVGLMPLMVGVYGAISIIENPDGPVGFWMSMVPFTSPIAMMARVAYGVSVWEFIVSAIILVATVFFMVWFASKIYKTGILMYGKKPSFKEWLKWLRY